MKKLLIILGYLLMNIQANAQSLASKIDQKKWLHGAVDCTLDTAPAIDILALDDDTYILRQNKCTHYEAPFIYVLFGKESVFIQDTGATKDSAVFPLYQTIEHLKQAWQKKHKISSLNMLVTHSHSHSDHIAADVQFKGKENVVVVEPNNQAVRTFFGLNEWPLGQASLDLGERLLTIIPLPGHHKDAIAVLDHQTNMMLTGDSFYPGRLYIKEWSVYQQSIARLVSFAEQHHVNTFLGTHIEMTSQAGVDYKTGTTYQPDERSLVLTFDDLTTLNQALINQGDTPKRETLEKMIIYPVD